MTVTKAMTQAQVNDKARVAAMLPNEQQAHDNNPAGHRQFHIEGGVEVAGPDATGRYEWANAFTSNEHGTLTREAEGVVEMFAPFVAADNARFGAMQKSAERECLRDGAGRAQYVDAEKASSTAQANGWHHRVTGRASKRYIRGVWYVKQGGEWVREDQCRS